MMSVMANATERKVGFCGIDLHDATMLCATAVGLENPMLRTLSTTPEGEDLLIAQLRALDTDEVFVTYEASGQGFCLADRLQAAGFHVMVVAPTGVEHSRKQRSRKTDRNDTLKLFHMLRAAVLAGGELPAVWIPPHWVREDRELVRHRLQLGEDLTRVKNRISSLLKRAGIRRPKDKIKSAWTAKHIQWLLDLDGELPAHAVTVLGSLLAQLTFYLEQQDELDTAVAALADTPRYRDRAAALTAQIGVGVLSAMVVLTEMGDPTRFTGRRGVGSWLGLTPKSHESGQARDRKGHISRLGPGRVRKVLNQVTLVRLRHHEPTRQWMERQTKRSGKGKKKMIVAMMRKIGIELWHRAIEASA